MAQLWNAFLRHEGRTVDKWAHYFPAYESHFERFIDRPILFLEIGVSQGGSLQLWKEYLGPYATIVGIDINPGCAKYEEDQIHVRIGSQSDTDFLASVLEEFGCPDVILDDGSHKMSDVQKSFECLYPRMQPDGVYFVEDMHTAYWDNFGGGLNRPGTFIEMSKRLVDELNGEWVGGTTNSDFTATTLSMHFYDSCVVFEKGSRGRPRQIQRGGTP